MAVKVKGKKKSVFDPFRRIAKYTTAIRDGPSPARLRPSPSPTPPPPATSGSEDNDDTEDSVCRFEDTALYMEPALPHSEVQLRIRWRCSVAMNVHDVVTIHLPGFHGPTRMFALQQEDCRAVGEGDDEPGDFADGGDDTANYATYFQAYWAGEEKNDAYTSRFGKPGKNGVPARHTLTLLCVRPIEPNARVSLVTPLSLNLISPDKLSPYSTKLKIEARLGGGAGRSSGGGGRRSRVRKIRKQPLARCSELHKRNTAEELTVLEEYMTRLAEHAGLSRDERHIAESLTDEEMFYMTESVIQQRQPYSLAVLHRLPWMTAVPIFTHYEASGSFVKLVMESVLSALRERDGLGLHKEVARNWNVKVGAVVLLEELLAMHTAGLYRGLQRGSLLACWLYTMEPADVVRCFPTVQMPAYSIKRELESAFRCYYMPVPANRSSGTQDGGDGNADEEGGTRHGRDAQRSEANVSRVSPRRSVNHVRNDAEDVSAALDGGEGDTRSRTIPAAAAAGASIQADSIPPSSHALRARAESLVKKWPYVIAALLIAHLRLCASPPSRSRRRRRASAGPLPDRVIAPHSHSDRDDDEDDDEDEDEQEDYNVSHDDVCNSENDTEDESVVDGDGEESSSDADGLGDEDESTRRRRRRRRRFAAPPPGQAVLRGPLPPLYVGVQQLPQAVLRELSRMSRGDWLMLPGCVLAREDTSRAAPRERRAARTSTHSKSRRNNSNNNSRSSSINRGKAKTKSPALATAALRAARRGASAGSGGGGDEESDDAACSEDSDDEEVSGGGGGDEAGREQAVLLELHGVHEAVELADVSSYPYHRDWLLPFGATFRVRGVHGPHVSSTRRVHGSNTHESGQHKRYENEANSDADVDHEGNESDVNSAAAATGSSSASCMRIRLRMVGSLTGNHIDPHIPPSDRSVITVLKRKLQADAAACANKSCAVAQMMLCHAQRQSRRRRYPPSALSLRYQDSFAAVRWTSEALGRVESGAVQWEQCTRAAERLAEGVVAPAVWEAVSRKYATGLERLFVRRRQRQPHPSQIPQQQQQQQQQQQRMAGKGGAMMKNVGTASMTSSAKTGTNNNSYPDDALDGSLTGAGWTVNWATWTWEVMGGKGGAANVGPRPIRRRVGRCITHEPSLLLGNTAVLAGSNNNTNNNNKNGMSGNSDLSYESIEELQERIQLTSATLAGLDSRLGLGGTGGNAASLGGSKGRAETLKKAEAVGEAAARTKKTKKMKSNKGAAATAEAAVDA